MKTRNALLLALLIAFVSNLGQPTVVHAAPNAPSTINAESVRGTGVITVKWSSVSGATAYQARILIGSVAIKTSTTISSSADRSHTFVGLEFNVPYKVQVRASDGTWSTYGDAAQNPVTPLAGIPSAPAQPSVAVTDDMKIKATWSPPTSTGGSPIASYSIQLMKGTEPAGEPVTTTGLEIELKTKDKTNSYSITVAAINEANVKSEASEASQPIIAEKKANAVVALPSNPSNGGGNAPSSGGGNSPTGGGGNAPAVKDPPVDQITRIVSPVPFAPTFTKVVKIKATTTSKTLVALSKLATPKGSKTSFSIASSSKKFCQLSGTSVRSLKAGTCSVKVTVTSKSGKKTSRTVKLVAR